MVSQLLQESQSIFELDLTRYIAIFQHPLWKKIRRIIPALPIVKSQGKRGILLQDQYVFFSILLVCQPFIV